MFSLDELKHAPSYSQNRAKLEAIAAKMQQAREARMKEAFEAGIKENLLRPRSRLAGGVVRDTPEIQRILKLPRKNDEQVDLVWLASEMTAILKTNTGTMSLRPVQAEALRDLSVAKAEGKHQGIFSPARVGAGKTLISLLAATVLDAQRPLLLVPAKLIKKTQRDAAQLYKHWLIPEHLKIQSYEKLSRLSGELFLVEMAPDLIIADEVHKLKNRDAAVTRRVIRYMDANPETVFVALSGTITKRSLNDYAHLLKWTHKNDRPIPSTYTEVEEWALALDEKVIDGRRKNPGALLRFCNKEELQSAARSKSEALSSVRRGFQRRLSETPGVVITPSSDIDASLTIQELRIIDVVVILGAFYTLRKEWSRPDGVDFSDPVEIYRAAKQLALGFYYRWNPAPPKDWMEARKNWNRLVRQVLSKHKEGLDSPLMIANAIRDGRIDGQDTLAAWKDIEPTFKPKTETVWLTESVLYQCKDWAVKNGGIIWVEHVEVGKKMEELYGIPYYGRQGLDARKRFIDDHKPGTPLIASIGSNSEGRNLQAWNENLITSVMPNALQWEQVIGRTHRDGQQADEVGFDVLVGCIEHLKHFYQSMADAKYQLDTLGQPQKLLLADVTMSTIEEAQVTGKEDLRFAESQPPE